jgi:hypothetical protein
VQSKLASVTNSLTAGDVHMREREERVSPGFLEDAKLIERGGKSRTIENLEEITTRKSEGIESVWRKYRSDA